MKALILALSLTLVSSAVLAQSEDEPPSGNKVAKLERMQNNLGLTDEQVQQMRDIRQAGGSREDMNAVLNPEQQAKAAKLRKTHKGKGGDRKRRLRQLDLSDEQKTQIQNIRKEGGSREEVRAVLTPEQQAKLDAAHEKHKEAGVQAGQ
jgi:Spy/CpxP family protein refolding chaperone